MSATASQLENQQSVYTYHNHYFDIGNKNALPLQLFMQQSPSFEHLRSFCAETYGPKGVKITPVEVPVIPVKEKHIDYEELTFIERPKWDPKEIAFPVLPPVRKSDIMEDVE